VVAKHCWQLLLLAARKVVAVLVISVVGIELAAGWAVRWLAACMSGQQACASAVFV
jgi:hypothetical protein